MWSRVLTRPTAALPAAVLAGSSRGLRSRRIIHVWDRVQPSFWYPMASLEQSLMDMEVMARRVFSPRFPPFAAFSPSMMPELHHDDDEFFKDLPIGKPQEAMKTAAAASDATGNAPEKEGTEVALDKKEPSTGAEGTVPHPSYTSYSYSYSTVLDHGGHRIGTARRRYEDSTGRLKATHEREIDGKKIKQVWLRSNTQDEGGHKTVCSSGSPEEFEKEWLETPFGRAEDEEQAKWLEDRERSVYQAFGIEYKPDETMEKLKQGQSAEPATPEERKVVEEGGPDRKETIEKMSKRQEEETTPPQFTS
ncbi:hypothetical protein PF005_g6684 [Phytophthora fragariae]|uniref:Uncharacterized protein n=1 Tax=Phytophthora fragariae TaxID=53985 RepID=A0A6A3YS31_9STRA|nr:hypothetical protein PF003_g21991 [Phytophthora fragariae]KAE8942848.1 hypothetical protein PF009_g7413 [Phytophthora fragariae]KAE9020046.1 hypothetical protein PF011_g5575 [Phytophthora fragariae]KAE9123980.1 hypothetical protein PF007_g6863 [Phytophthora fragariae]KAE9124790.1 hypothetical protein PF010_g5868 [Phytophthora fragariae]